MDQKEAAELFIQRIILGARVGTIGGVKKWLEFGPPGREPENRLVEMHAWFRALDKNNQDAILNIVQEAIDRALFNALVVLDGYAGGLPLKGVESDFALYLQTYREAKDEALDKPLFRIKINPWHSTEALHDIYMWEVRQ